MKLAESLVLDGVLEDADDVWFSTAPDLEAFLEGRMPAETLRHRLGRNRAYHESFRNYQPPGEIGGGLGTSEPPAVSGKQVSGVGANAGTVTGTARVLASIDEVDRLKADDILVTRFTDTGWTPAFARLSGVVTEYGGILCHAAIVAREYGIPSVVTATGATTRIPDGARIHVDGTSGIVTIVSEGAPSQVAGPADPGTA